MNVATIKEPVAQAREKLREYRTRVHQRADVEYQQIERAYEAAAKGLPLLVLSEVIHQAPRDLVGRPRLAIARADMPQVRVTVRDASDVFNTAWEWRTRRHRDAVISVQRPFVPDGLRNYRAARKREWAAADGYSLVPIVPPDVRKGHADLSRRFILWEVEEWANEPVRATPDRDPYLLQRIGADLYAVVGEWDLTPLEQAIMRGRAG